MDDLKRKLEDQLTCSICQETFTDPRLLQCNHVYCRDCLAGLAGRNSQNLTCPNCRKVTTLPAGVEGLQAAFYTNNFLDILSEHKKMKLDVLYCPQHEDRELELYCKECKDRICLLCTKQQHKGHDYDLMSEILKPVDEQLTLALERLSVLLKEATDQQVAIQAQINESSLQLHKIIDLRKNELISKLNGITQEKLSELASQREQVELTQAQLSSGLDNAKENVRTGRQGVQNHLLDLVKELTAAVFQPELNSKASMTFSSSHAAVEACRAHGLVSAPEIPEPGQCHALSAVPDVTTVGEKYTTLIQVNTHEGKPLNKTVHSLECELVSELTGTKERGIVKRKEHYQYEVSYKPTIKGRHKLDIKVIGEHIKGSPFSVAAKSPVEKLGLVIKSLSVMNGPMGIVISQSGNVVVTEYFCVTLYSPSGERLQSFGTRGSGQGQFDDLHGVAVDGEGNILVADYYNNRIQKFTGDGQFLKAVGTEGCGPLEFHLVKDIAFNPSNNQVYVSDENNRIQILNSDLTYLSTFGKYGKGDGEFERPTGIACDSTGNVYVADSDGNRIQVFTSTGKFLRMFGSCGEGKGELSYPTFITFDGEDNLYVSERENYRISVFNSEGQFVSSFGSEGEEPGEFECPYGVAVDSNGVVYVCDMNSNFIQLF